MRDFMHILIAAFGGLSFLIALVYAVGAVRTKDKNAAYISIALMIVCIISIALLTFR
ncbi:MAG: hypothetical protein KDD41_06960 [Flavobacteriales bacterium]|nr:hypothetical protein [Flavobacteriales bacterium]